MSRTLDLQETAEFLKISLATCQELAQNGELPGCKIGIGWVFLEEALVAYVKEQTETQRRQRREKSGIEARIAEGGSVKEVRRQRRKGPAPSLESYLPKTPGEVTPP